MLFPQPQMQPGITPVVPAMGMTGAIPTVGNPFPAPPMNMGLGPPMPEAAQVVIPPLGQAGSVEGPVIPPLPSSRRGRAATPYMAPEQWEDSSEEDDELTAEARARLQPPLRPGQYGPFDPVRDARTRTPHPILQQRSHSGDGGRRHRSAESSPAYAHDSPPFDDPPQPPVIPPGFTGGPPFPHHLGAQPMPDWPPQAGVGMGMGMGMPEPQPQQPVEPELPLPPFRPRPFEPIQRSNNPLPAPPRDILHSSPYAKLLEDLRRPIDRAELKAKLAAAPAIHTVGAVGVNLAPQPSSGPGYLPRSATTREKEREREREKTVRYSGSSFEAGALSSQGSPAHQLPPEEGARTLTRKKQSILGLGLPSTMRLSTVRDVSGASTASSAGVPQAPQRLSVDSAHLILNAQGRPSSILSSGSSLRPPSTISGISCDSGRTSRSSSSSVVSVRWDDVALRTVKEKQREERRTRRELEREKGDKEGSKTKRESRRSSESRRRTPISEIFPETQGAQRRSTGSLSPPSSIVDGPMVRIEEATADGHSAVTDEERSLSETPGKRVRPRPLSEQMLGRPRPQAICDNSDGDGELNCTILFLLPADVGLSHAITAGRRDERLGLAYQPSGPRGDSREYEQHTAPSVVFATG